MKTSAQKIRAPGPARTTPAALDKASPAVRPLEFNLAYRLSYMSFLVNRATLPVLLSHGLTNQQWKVLSVLYQLAPATAQEVTRWVTLDKSAVSRTVRQLLEQGLITRKLHAEDARNVNLLFTARGNALYKQVSEDLAAVQADLMQDVSPSAGAALFKALRQVEERLRIRLDNPAMNPVPEQEGA
ncbi:MAG: MarR family winged helix-turn-helix transcriptional regulator [Burkholderiaceae bacterium]